MSHLRPILFYHGALAWALVGSLLCYLAQPPAGLSLLAWIGPVPWIALIGRAELVGKRPYRALWLAGSVYWLLTIQWIRLPYPANLAGLILLAAYLGAYLPLFAVLVRSATQRIGIPSWLACPVVWTGLDYARAHLLTGFLMGSLAHTQTERLRVIQLADTLGEYGVSFLIVLVASSLTDALFTEAPRRVRWSSLIPGGVALAAAIGYGEWRLRPLSASERSPIIALVQGDSLADWKGSEEKERLIMTEHRNLTIAAVTQALAEQGGPPDVIVWPETMYRQALYACDENDEALQAALGDETLNTARRDLQTLARDAGAALIVGLDRVEARRGALTPEGNTQIDYRVYNSSAGVDRSGRLVGTYDKRHLLPFGEYTPLAGWFPFLNFYTPITGLAQPGSAWNVMALDGIAYAPNICYESALPHLIRNQVAELTSQGLRPDVLVNLTNDAWYWGSSELDMHLACGVFRAIETRTPMVAAANRGLSASIDAYGRVLAKSERNRAMVVTTRVTIPLRSALATCASSLYVAGGDWFAMSCLAACIGIGMFGRRWKNDRTYGNFETRLEKIATP